MSRTTVTIDREELDESERRRLLDAIDADHDGEGAE